MNSLIEHGLPQVISLLKQLNSTTSDQLTNQDVIRAWEADLTLFSYASLLADSIAAHSLQLRPNPPAPPLSNEPPLSSRLQLLHSLQTMQTHVQHALQRRVDAMSFKPRLYRLAKLLHLSPVEVRAFVYIILHCSGVEGPSSDERRFTPRPRSELFTCREFANMEGFQLLHFLSPSRPHFSQGLLEVEEEFAPLYSDNKFRAPREVLKAIYGCTLTLDEAMTLGTSALAEVLAEEKGSIIDADPASIPVKPSAHHPKDAVDLLQHHELLPHSLQNGRSSAREVTTDASSMLDFLSDLNQEEHTRREKRSAVFADGNESAETADDNSQDDDLSADVNPYLSDMEYLKDGFEVVQEACKVYNFREKNSEEDRYTSTKRPVEALQREADAKLRKASTNYSRRLTKTKQIGAFTPRLELLVAKLRLAHFERMVILTLVGSVLSQSIRKTLRSDPSSSYETGITVSKLLRVHCGGDLSQEIKSRSFFYRNATLIRSGIVTIDVPYNMPYSDLGDFCCELDHMVLDYVAGLHTELEEIMDSARCYSPKVDMDSVILPEKMKSMVIQRAENFELFRKLRKEVGFDDIVRYGKGLTLFFHGKSGTGKTLFANALASYLKKKLLVVDFASLNSSKHSNAEAYRIVFREAKVHGAIVFMDECDELFESRDRGGKGAVTVALREMETFDGIMILATNRPQMLDEAMHRRIALSLMFEAPDSKHRLAIWQKHIPKKLRLADDVDLRVLALEFELTGGYIKNAVFQALAQAVNRVQRDRKGKGSSSNAKKITDGDEKSEKEEEEGSKDSSDVAKVVEDSIATTKTSKAELSADEVIVTMAELRQACRLQARGDLKRTKLERRFLPTSGLEKLVVTEQAMKTLRDVVAVEKVRGLMSTRWGFKDRQSRSNCVLVMGPTGCGKTFAAGCLGFETGRPIQRLAASELHGSREGASQIGDVFGQAAVAGAVVVIEHAEQLLFETANPESTASPGLELMYHMQSFDGLVVLCCTTAQSPAEAGWPIHVPIPNRVTSLLSYIVFLQKPDRESRLKLWKQLIPKDTPISEELHERLGGIAEKYDFSGAKISSCIRRGAAAAAMRRNRASLVTGEKENASESLTTKDLEHACEAEVELGKDSDGTAAWVRGLYV